MTPTLSLQQRGVRKLTPYPNAKPGVRVLAFCSALPLDDRQGSPTQGRLDFLIQGTGMSPPLAAMLRAKMEGRGDKCHALHVRYQLGPQKPSSLHAPGSMRTEVATRGHKYRLMPPCVNEETVSTGTG